MRRILQLDANVINKIAAGEVIERPASVVKELMENSVDALASRIEVDIAQGGTELIRIVDNGQGIHPDDMLLAVSSHATSKIRSDADLFSVQTMGFRGEALASIASVSRFTIRSRQADSDAGNELEVVCGNVGKPQACGCPHGTVMEVRQLFGNTPVRRKFLKTVATEFGHISEHFTRVALANPRIHMVLRHNNKIVHELPASDKLQDRLRMFHGSQLTESLIWIDAEQPPMPVPPGQTPDEAVRLWGYVAHPSQHKSSRKGQHLFLNGRWIQDRTLQHALTEAYRGLLMVGRQPICFLFLEVPPHHVDVNVHPTKVEVRFRDSQQLYRLMLSSVRTKFLSMDLDSEIRVQRGSQATDDAPNEDQQREEQRKLDLGSELDQWADHATGIDSTTSSEIGSGALGESYHESRPGTAATNGSGPRTTFAPAQYPGWKVDDSFRDRAASTSTATGSRQSYAPPTDVTSTNQNTASPPASDSEASPANGFHRVDVSQPGPPRPVRAIQVHNCYIALETEEGLTVIDQHALHERVMYEQLRPRVLANSVETQRLLVPEAVEFTVGEAAMLVEHAETLAQLGYLIEEFGGGTVLLTGYPAMLKKANHVQLLRDMCEHLQSSGQKPTRRDLLDSLLHMMSCKAAIKAGQRLAPEEIDSLLAQRHLVDDAHHCPHGRPTALVLSRAELDKQFGRLG
ncbi:MAG: DNA mismatch repair endonuclease MutL [Planctomycetota bacterium]|nr:DNA mismatch repair endonuclease MutL [Planctomycetota bacterium]